MRLTGWLERRTELLYAVLRMVAGFLFACHGAQKVFGVLGGDGVALMSRIGLAGVIELVGGALIAVGLFTPYIAFIASGEMAFAYFLAHAPQGFWPILNRGEPAMFYCFLFLYMAARGAGAFSLDGMLRRTASPESGG